MTSLYFCLEVNKKKNTAHQECEDVLVVENLLPVPKCRHWTLTPYRKLHPDVFFVNVHTKHFFVIHLLLSLEFMEGPPYEFLGISCYYRNDNLLECKPMI